MGLIRIWTVQLAGKGAGWGRGGLASSPDPAFPRFSVSEPRPKLQPISPHYFSQLLISASKGSLPAVIAKDPSLCASGLRGPQCEAARAPTRVRARAPAAASTWVPLAGPLPENTGEGEGVTPGPGWRREHRGRGKMCRKN